ncbi:unnamed protein product [Chrysodeixis includens]|uniref:Uncharacterized protein n=1 Tax=Chrysodeixis includens TaxID=689277 RepID=A0A9P0BZ03_CHRIL|nr:unnamed protein product [Chrysodeixis includens]
MEKKPKQEDLSDVKVEVIKVKERRVTHPGEYEREDRVEKVHRKVTSRSNDFVYVNSAYVGSLNSVNEGRTYERPTSVIREQYWTCSKWSFAKKVLAIALGLFLGAVIGLGVTMTIKGVRADEVIEDMFRNSAPD